MVMVKLTKKEVDNLIHLLKYDNENWEMAGCGWKFIQMNDRCLKKLGVKE